MTKTINIFTGVFDACFVESVITTSVPADTSTKTSTIRLPAATYVYADTGTTQPTVSSTRSTTAGSSCQYAVYSIIANAELSTAQPSFYRPTTRIRSTTVVGFS